MAKIMVVEDEGVIRQLIMEELKKWQFEVCKTKKSPRIYMKRL